jgi:hypothetical protein
VKDHVKNNNEVIFGRRAMNRQIHGFLGAPTVDYDIYSRNPRRSATMVKRKMNKEIGGGFKMFYTQKAIHPGTHRVMHIGSDFRRGTEDDFAIVDFSPMPKRLKTIESKGLRFQRLDSIAAGKRKTLKDPFSKFRHAKDRMDLQRIKASQQLGGGKR